MMTDNEQLIEEMILEAQEEAVRNSEEYYDFNEESAFDIMYGKDSELPDDLREAWLKAYKEKWDQLEDQKLIEMERSCGC